MPDRENDRFQMLARAIHDLRQPLQAMQLYISALQRRVETEEARAILAKLDRAAQSLSDHLSALTEYGRLCARAAPELRAVSLQDTFNRVRAAFADADTAATSLVIQSDPLLLETLLGHLVDNALKHGGGAAHIEAREMNGQAEIAVIDKGPGLAPEDQRRIFDEFVRLDGRGDRLGLGLSSAKRIALLLNHDLEVRSQPGAGASFIVRAPLA